MQLAKVPQLPIDWILIDDEGVWIVPNVPGGLARRVPYRGNQTPRPISAQEARLMLHVLGETMLGVAEIADRLGVKADTVHAWRRRHEDFPTPIAELRAGPVWAASDIDRWREQPRPAGRPRRRHTIESSATAAITAHRANP